MAGQLDLRSDSSLNFGNAITWGNAALKINVDRALNGTGSGQVMSLGTITETVTGLTMTATNAVGVGANNNGSNIVNNYGLRIAGLILNAGTTTTIANAIANNGPALFAVPSAGTGVAGALVIDNVSTAAGLGNFTLNLNTLGYSGAVTIISGDIVQNTGTTLALAVSQAGGRILTLGGPSMTSVSA